MFHDLHVQNDIKLFARRSHIFGGGVAIVDGQAGLFGMHLRHWDVTRCSIGANNRRPKPRHGFRQKAPATADVENPQAREGRGPRKIAVKLRGDLAGDVIQTAGVHQMQRFELAVGVPPLGSHGFEFGHFGGIDGGGHAELLAHGRDAAQSLDTI